jgi:hypothetical protein
MKAIKASLLLVLATLGAVVVLSALIALGAVWNAKNDVRTLHASQRALEIEIANYRAALEALVEQVGSQTAPLPIASPASRQPAGAIESVQPLVRRGRVAETEAPVPPAFTKALAGLTQARASAEAADAPLLASQSYQAAMAAELEAGELLSAGRLTDAMVRAVEADARFRAAEIEARAETAALERLHLVDAARVSPSLPAAAESPPKPAESPGELRQALHTSGPPPGIDVEKPIHDVIAQYVNGLESRSVATLKRVWPSLGGNQERAIQTEFENARTVHTLFSDPRITVTGDITTVTGLRIYSLVTQDGQRLTSLTRTTMTLRRSGDAWVIERVVHQQ